MCTRRRLKEWDGGQAARSRAVEGRQYYSGEGSAGGLAARMRACWCVARLARDAAAEGRLAEYQLAGGSGFAAHGGHHEGTG